MKKERMLTALDVFQTVEMCKSIGSWNGSCVSSQSTLTRTQEKRRKKKKKGGSVGKKKTRKKKVDVNGPKNKNSYTPLKFGGLKEIGVQWI